MHGAIKAADVKHSKPLDSTLEIPNAVTGLDGVIRSYYPNGQIKEELSYIEGVLNGPCKLYYKSGEVEMESFYVSGELDGLHRRYSSDSQILQESYYSGGKLEGISRGYNIFEGTIEEMIYIDDIAEGVSRLYISGSPEGLHWSKLNAGKTVVEETYVNGIKEGFCLYNTFDFKELEVKYENGGFL